MVVDWLCHRKVIAAVSSLTISRLPLRGLVIPAVLGSFFDGRQAFVSGFGKPADADASGFLSCSDVCLQWAEVGLQLLFIRSKPIGQTLLGRHVGELGMGRILRWIAADDTGEASLEQRMEPWIGQHDNLCDVRFQIPDESQDPQLVSQIPCGGQHKNAPAACV